MSDLCWLILTHLRHFLTSLVDSCWLVWDSCWLVLDSCWLVSDSCWLVSDSCWFVLTRVDLCWYSCRIDLINKRKRNNEDFWKIPLNQILIITVKSNTSKTEKSKSLKDTKNYKAWFPLGDKWRYLTIFGDNFPTIFDDNS